MRPALGPVAAKLKIVPFSPFSPPVPEALLPAYRRVVSQLFRCRFSTLGDSAMSRFVIRRSVCMRRRKAKLPYRAATSVLPAMTVKPDTERMT